MSKSIEQRKQREQTRRAQSCKHYRGTVEPVCAAGVNLRQLAGGPDLGWACRLPCNPFLGEREPGAVVACEKKELPTAEEVAAEEAAWAATLDRFTKVLPLVARIKLENKGKSASGKDNCPCCDGQVRWSIASINGHVWMKCSTDGCIAFME